MRLGKNAMSMNMVKFTLQKIYRKNGEFVVHNTNWAKAQFFA